MNRFLYVVESKSRVTGKTTTMWFSNYDSAVEESMYQCSHFRNMDVTIKAYHMREGLEKLVGFVARENEYRQKCKNDGIKNDDEGIEY